ncbi:MAG: hypothetical protein AVDCRST_MAG77-4450 [uncultured Chloroflexi bacterium]|uniref:Uncharacterized protein n=1 Tax=uncultured Chloroflexota bacterium TaxID=166587 RepID=A0A6J4JUD6_9CHLR|nr:MAG: hypothetical protein AVDCRST_MAG77-4450 [uncultured Chloroflexota bacterium]
MNAQAPSRPSPPVELRDPATLRRDLLRYYVEQFPATESTP